MTYWALGGKGMVGIEFLTGLGKLPPRAYFLFAALKIASTTCVIGAIVGEWIGSSFGLGALIIEATYNFRSPLLYATVFTAALLAVVLFTFVSVAESRLIRWKAPDVH